MTPRSHGLWGATAVSAPETVTLRGSAQAEIAIIGAGFTGLSAALHLTAQGHEVAVIDAGAIGQGCSGRNGGQVNPGWKLDPNEITRHYEGAWADSALHLAKSAVPALSDLVRSEGLDCDFIENGYVQGAVGARGLASINQRTAQWIEHGIDAEVLSRAATADLLGTHAYSGAMVHSQGGNLHPLSYARELARVVLARGGQIFTSTPAIKAQRGANDGWVVHTPSGTLESRKLLIATNGYTDGFWPGLAQAVVSVASALSATEPLPEAVASSILPGLHSVSETRRIQVYYRMTVDGRFVIGGRGATFGRAEDSTTAPIRAIAERYFPALKGAKWNHDWAGTVAITWDHAPKLMALDEGVFAGMGFNGRGVAMATAMGGQLARAVRGEATDLPITDLYRTPFHAFRKLGVFSTLLRGRMLDRLDRLDQQA